MHTAQLTRNRAPASLIRRPATPEKALRARKPGVDLARQICAVRSATFPLAAQGRNASPTDGETPSFRSPDGQ
jgi:hypothetical protein